MLPVATLVALKVRVPLFASVINALFKAVVMLTVKLVEALVKNGLPKPPILAEDVRLMLSATRVLPARPTRVIPLLPEVRLNIPVPQTGATATLTLNPLTDMSLFWVVRVLSIVTDA